MKNMIAFLFAVCFLSGCAVAPLQKEAIAKGVKVGIVVRDFPQELRHVHIGTTVFNNFDKNYPLSFNMSEHVINRASQDLKNLGYLPISLKLTDPEQQELQQAVKRSDWDGSFSLSPTAQNTLSALKQKYGVDLIITYYSDNHFPAGNYGLFTQSFFNMNLFKVYSFINMDAVKTDPPAINGHGQYIDNPPLPEFNTPLDFKNIPATEIYKVESAIMKRIDLFIDNTVESSTSARKPKEIEGAFIL